MPEKGRHRKGSRTAIIEDRLAMDLTSLSNERTLHRLHLRSMEDDELEGDE